MICVLHQPQIRCYLQVRYGRLLRVNYSKQIWGYTRGPLFFKRSCRTSCTLWLPVFGFHSDVFWDMLEMKLQTLSLKAFTSHLDILQILLQTRLFSTTRKRNFRQCQRAHCFSLQTDFFLPCAVLLPFYYVFEPHNPQLLRQIKGHQRWTALPLSLFFVQMKGTDLIGSDTSVGDFYVVTLNEKTIWRMIQHVLRKQWEKDKPPFICAHISA